MTTSFLRTVLVAFALTSGGAAIASNSFKLTTVLSGWERIHSGPTLAAGTDLVRRAALRFGHFCIMPEVFVRSGTTSLHAARWYFERHLPMGAEQRVLVDLMSQRVTRITAPRLRTAVLSAMVPTRTGVMLALC